LGYSVTVDSVRPFLGATPHHRHAAIKRPFNTFVFFRSSKQFESVVSRDEQQNDSTL